jgi:hypothetical protein
MQKIRCDYCDKPARLVRGNVIYPSMKDLHHKQYWHCAPCEAHVGCHPNTSKPLGRLANASLRAAKMRAHEAFDPLWKSQEMTRTDAYAWLAEALGISKANCHIGMMDDNMCMRVVTVCVERRYKDDK